MMPSILHQIWVGTNPIPKREWALCVGVREAHPEWEYRLWSNEMVASEPLPDNVRLAYDGFYSEKKFAFCADLLRMWVVYQYGGVYLDVDFEILKPLDSFLPYNGLIMYHENAEYGEIPNGVFGMTTHHPILKYCLEQVENGWHFFGPSWFGQKIKASLGLEFKSPRAAVQEAMNNLYISNPCWEEWHGVYAKHHALYSWSDLYIPGKIDGFGAKIED